MSDSNLERILIIDDNSDYRKLINTFISKLLPGAEVIEYDPVFEGVPDDEFDWSDIDVLLLDYHLSIVGTTGLDILHKHHKKHSFPATIMLTGAGTEEIAIRALKSGIYEYLPKQSLTKDKLKQSIIHAWEDKKAKNKKKQELTQHNRSFSKEVFYENLEKAFTTKGQERALVIIQPDNLNILEEEIGIIGRDSLINHIAKHSFEVFKLGACNPNITKISDTEIGVQIDYPINLETLNFNMQGLSDHLAKCTFKFAEEKYKFSVSIGILKLGLFNKAAEQLINIATIACKHASKTEGNSFYIWKDSDIPPDFMEQADDEALVTETSSTEENTQKLEAELKAKEQAEAKIKAAEEEKKKLEAELKAKEEEAKTQAALRAEQEAKEKAEAELKAREETEKAKIEAEQRAEQEAKEKAEAEAKMQAAREEKEKLQAELKAKEEEVKAQAALRAEQEAKEKAEAEAKIKLAEEEKEKLEAELKAKEEITKAQAALHAEQEAKEKAEAEAKIKLAEEEKKKLEAELKAKEETEKAKIEAEQRAEQEAKEKAEAEAKMLAAEEEKKKLEAELKAKEEEAKAQAALRAEQEAKEKAEAEAKIKAAEEEKEKLQAELRAKEEAANSDAALRIEQETKEKLEAEAEMKAAKEAKEKLEAELKAIAKAKEEAEAEMKAAKEAKEKLEAELKAIAETKATEEAQKTTSDVKESDSNTTKTESIANTSDAKDEQKQTEEKVTEEIKQDDEIEENTGPSLEEIEVQIKKLIDENKIIQTYQPITAMFGDEGDSREIYKTGLQALSEREELNEYLADTSVFSVALQQSINEWILRQVFLRITESGTDKCQYLFLVSATESWFSDIALFQWLQKILQQTKKYNPGGSIILDVPLELFVKHQKRAQALIDTLRKTHNFTISLSNLNEIENLSEHCSLAASKLLIVNIEQLKKLSETLGPNVHEKKEINDEPDGEEEQEDKQNLLQYLKAKNIKIITSGIEDSTLLTDAITAGTDYTLGDFVGEVQENLTESSMVESFELT